MDEFQLFQNSPIDFINSLFDKLNAGDHANWESLILSKLNSLISWDNEEQMSKISLLNSSGSSTNEDFRGSIVRFRCMVQNIFDPELYLGVYYAKTGVGGLVARSGIFRDSLPDHEAEQLLHDHPNNKLLEVTQLYCVEVPGENSWVKKADKQTHRVNSTHFTEACSMNGGSSLPSGLLAHGKVTASGLNTPLKVLENMKYGEATSKSCFARIYGAGTKFAINDVIELVGIVSNDTLIEEGHDDMGEQNSNLGLSHGLRRVHVIAARKLDHIHPGLPQQISSADFEQSPEACFMNEIRGLLRDSLLGDELAAEYVLMNMISQNTSRVDGIPVTKFALNLRRTSERDLLILLSDPSELFSSLEATVGQLVTKSVYLPLTRAFLNEQSFIPSKTIEDDQTLQAGILQLSDKTYVMINETVLEEGQLTVNGTKNIKALQTLASHQMVEYELPFQKIKFETDLPILVYSIGKSIVKCDFDVLLEPSFSSEDQRQKAKARLAEFLKNENLMNKARVCLTLAAVQSYNMPDSIAEMIQDDFVHTRKSKETKDRLDAEDLHRLLNLARLYCFTHGKNTLDKDVWEEVRALETRRKNRLSS